MKLVEATYNNNNTYACLITADAAPDTFPKVMADFPEYAGNTAKIAPGSILFTAGFNQLFTLGEDGETWTEKV